MKTHEEIKKGLLYHGNTLCDDDCPYRLLNGFGCKGMLCNDALALIQQLEKELELERSVKKATLVFTSGSDITWEIERMPGWISVEERLPEKGKFVLLQYAKNAQNPTLHARNTMAVGRYEYGMFLVEGCSVKVTHWMPLPEPPEV